MKTKILTYVDTRANRLSLEELIDLRKELDNLLAEKIDQRVNPSQIKLKPLNGNPNDKVERNIEIVKCCLNGETQPNVAKKFNTASTTVAEKVKKYTRYFNKYLRFNEDNPPSVYELSAKRITPELKEQFFWFLDHYEYIRGTKTSEKIHIPASKKLITEKIGHTQLPTQVKNLLLENGFDNMGQVAYMSFRQIKKIPMIKPDDVDAISTYLLLYPHYTQSASPQEARSFSYL